MFFILWTSISWASNYDLKFLESDFFNQRDKKRITRYLNDLYLIDQRKLYRAKYSQNLFRFLRESILTDARQDLKNNPFAGLEWPANGENLEYLIQEIENKNEEK